MYVIDNGLAKLVAHQFMKRPKDRDNDLITARQFHPVL